MADYDGDDTLVATYNTPGLDSNLTKKIGESVYFYLKDGQRSIRNLLDSDETAQNTYDYKAFGSVYGSPTENITNRYRYTSREWESVLDLYFSRARMYDPSIGRFLGRDPLGGGCCGNNYSYACNRPLLFSDPLGLYTVLFKGYHKKAATTNKVVDYIADILNDEDEPAKVYEHHNWWWGAWQDLGNHLAEQKLKNCQHPKINIVGYSCGTDSALKIAQLLEAWVKRNKVEGLELRNLFYLDFNWGTIHADDCRHDTNNEYKTPDIVGNTFHWVSMGIMRKEGGHGCPKCYVSLPPCGFEYNPYFYLPSCQIIAHTGNLWRVWPDPDGGKDWLEITRVVNTIWAGVEGWDRMAADDFQSIMNTTGALSADYIGKYGFPNALQADWKGYNMDHLDIGDNPTVARDVADVILALGV